MTPPSNDDLANALEQFASGDSPPSTEKTPEPMEQTRPELPSSAAPEIVETEEPAVEADDWVMGDVSAEVTPAATAARSPVALQNRPPLYRTMQFRQTIIPILLTCGVLTLAFSSLKFVLGPDSIFSDLPLWLPIVLLLAGVVLLFLAVLNMLAVKHAR
jgi:hypothetical protein